jgi:hypothetical protein
LKQGVKLTLLTTAFAAMLLMTPTASGQLAVVPLPEVDEVYPPVMDWAGLRVLHIGDSHVGNPGLTQTLQAHVTARRGSYRAIHWVGSRSQTWLTSGRLRQALAEENPDIVIVTLDTNALRIPHPEKYATWIRAVVERIGTRGCYWVSPPPLIADEFGLFDAMMQAMGRCRLFDSRTLDVSPRANGRFHLTVAEAEAWAEAIWHWMNASAAPGVD